MAYTALVIWSPASSRAEELARWKVPKSEDRLRLILSHCREREREREREWWRWTEAALQFTILVCSFEMFYPISSPGWPDLQRVIKLVLHHPYTDYCQHNVMCCRTDHFLGTGDLILRFPASPLNVFPLTETRLLQQTLCEGVRGEERRRAVT